MEEWFSSKASQQTQYYIKPKDVKVDKKMSVLKLLQAKWITSFFDNIESRPDMITIGWKKMKHCKYFATGYTLKEKIAIC